MERINLCNYKGILFDFDGTLAVTMEDNYAAWKRAMQHFNVEIAPSDYFPFEGMKLTEIAGNLCKKYKLNLRHVDEIVKKKEEYYLKNNKFKFYPSVEEIVAHLKSNNILIGMVTAARLERLEKTIPIDFLNLFNTIITADKTKAGKPDPEPYLLGLKELNIKAKDCIAVENAPLGIESAKNAGLKCIAICSTMDKNYLSKADLIIDKFYELNNLFGADENRRK